MQCCLKWINKLLDAYREAFASPGKHLKKQSKEIKRMIEESENRKKELLKNLYMTFWEIVKMNFGTSISMMTSSTIMYDRDAALWRRVLNRASYELSVLVIKVHVISLNDILKRGRKYLDQVDAEIASRSLKPLKRPDELKLPDFKEEFKKSDWIADIFSNAYDALNAKAEEWQNLYDLAARQVQLFIDGKNDVSACDDLKREEDERKAKTAAEEKAAETVIVRRGETPLRVTMEWREFRNPSFDISHFARVAAFHGAWYVMDQDGDVWKSADGEHWQKVEMPIKVKRDFDVTDEALIAWGDERTQYAFTLDGEKWEVGENHIGGLLTQKRIVRFADKWLLCISQDEPCEGVKGRGIFKRKVKIKCDKSRVYTSDTLSGGWSEEEKMRSEDGYYVIPKDIVVRNGVMYTRKRSSLLYWSELKKEAPEWQKVKAVNLNGWFGSDLSDENFAGEVRFGEFGCKLNLSATWGELTTNGIDYTKLFIGNHSWNFAVKGDRILKICDGKDDPRICVGRLAVVKEPSAKT